MNQIQTTIKDTEELKEAFRKKFGQFYVSIDAKTKAIRVVDIVNGLKVNGTYGDDIECVASGDIEKWIQSEFLSRQTALVESVVALIRGHKFQTYSAKTALIQGNEILSQVSEEEGLIKLKDLNDLIALLEESLKA